MTKYEEMPLGSQILPGDRVTKVFEVMQGLRISSADCGTITKIERPIPEVELPTVPGFYLSTKYPLSVYRRRWCGQWYGTGGKVTEARIRELTPLTRLVPETETTPATLADRLDVKKVSDLLAHIQPGITAYPKTSADALIFAIDAGDLDK